MSEVWTEVSSRAVSVGTTPVQLITSGSRVVSIYNNGSDVVYLGGSNVDSTNGMPLKAGERLTIYVTDYARLYAVAGSPQELRVMEAK